MHKIKSASWGATICDRIVLEDGRVVFAHYRVDSYSVQTWKLQTVMVDQTERIGSARQTFSLDPIAEDVEPDVLPEWLCEVLASKPLNVPAMAQVSA